MNRKYLKMEIEADDKERPNLIRAVVTYEENGKLYNNYAFGRSILSELKAFAAQENTSVYGLIHDETKVNFQITTFAKHYKPYIDGYEFNLSASEITGCETLLYGLKNKQKEQKFASSIKLPKLKSVVKVVAFGALIIIVGNYFNYNLQKIDALGNQYVNISLNSISKEMSPDMVHFLSDYEQFDFIMSNIAKENWSELENADLSRFFNDLNWINLQSSANIMARLNGERTSITMYTTHFEEYFKDTPNDYCAIKYINKCFNDILDSMGNEKEIKNALDKYLKFVIDKSNNCTEYDSNGKPVFIRYDTMSPMAKYLINSQMINIIRAYNSYNYNAYGYNWLTQEAIIKKIENELRGSYSAVLGSIEIDKRK